MIVFEGGNRGRGGSRDFYGMFFVGLRRATFAPLLFALVFIRKRDMFSIAALYTFFTRLPGKPFASANRQNQFFCLFTVDKNASRRKKHTLTFVAK